MKIEITAIGNELTSGHNTTLSLTASGLLQAGFAIGAIDCIGEAVYGHDQESLPLIVGRLLLASKKTLATAESCTGGMIGQWLTAIPGSSAWYQGGVICYANRVKEEVLAVPAAILAAHGAVSAEVATAMSMGARRLCHADLAVAVTGIAGPDGGSAEKPVGTVYIGLADADGAKAERFLFHGDRQRIREMSAQTALKMVRKLLLAS
ncbi:MAG: nicotinamide-nucleotide amidohydrolase family protein [Desulfobulbaceae bacterium]|jgi:nicotinamide-nucleotide amidase|nr:nicotinamide-nucleotide amidohydrolase family protein [Desulfobulbaceae bacterium]